MSYRLNLKSISNEDFNSLDLNNDDYDILSENALSDKFKYIDQVGSFINLEKLEKLDVKEFDFYLINKEDFIDIIYQYGEHLKYYYKDLENISIDILLNKENKDIIRIYEYFRYKSAIYDRYNFFYNMIDDNDKLVNSNLFEYDSILYVKILKEFDWVNNKMLIIGY